MHKTKKRQKKPQHRRSEYEHYQPNNPLTIYFAKLIHKQPENKSKTKKQVVLSSLILYTNRVEVIYTQTNTHERRKIMSTNKNAYEIRADILKEATGLIQNKFDREFNVWEMTRTRDLQTGKIMDPIDQPKYPTTQEILDCANELYSFVDSK